MTKDVDLTDLMSGAPKAVDLGDLGAKSTPGVRAALKDLIASDAAMARYKASKGSKGDGGDLLTDRFLNSMTLGAFRPAIGALSAGITAAQRAVPGGKNPSYSPKDAMDAYRIYDRAKQQGFSAEHPGMALASDIGGALAMPGAGALGKFVVGETAPRLAAAGLKIPKAVRATQTARLMGTSGALTGVASGMQAAPGEAIKDAEHGVVTGALLAPVAELGGAGVAKVAPKLTRLAMKAVGKGPSAEVTSAEKLAKVLRKDGVDPDTIYAAIDEWKANGVSPNLVDILKTAGATPAVFKMLRNSGTQAPARVLAEKYAEDTVKGVQPKVLAEVASLKTGEPRTPTQIRTDLATLNESAAAKAAAHKAEIAAKLEADTAAKTAREAAGAKVQSATAKWAADMKTKGADLITQAEEKATGVKLPVADTQDYLTKQIDLLERNPEANKVKIGVLSKWKSDLENNVGDLSSLRDLKSSIYETKSTEGLEAGPMAKLRADFSHALDADIRKGLDAAGEATPVAREALGLYDEANKMFTERYDVMDKVGKKVLGDKVILDESDPEAVEYVASRAPESAADIVRKLASDDHRGFETLMNVIDPEAQGAAREHVIGSLGRDAKGVVDPVKFAAETKALPAKSRELLFGSESPETAADRALVEGAKVDDTLAAETADPAAQEAALTLGEGALKTPSEEYVLGVDATDAAHIPVAAAGAKQAVANAIERVEPEGTIAGLTSPQATQNLGAVLGNDEIAQLQQRIHSLSTQGRNARELAITSGAANPQESPLVDSVTPYDIIDPRRGGLHAVLNMLRRDERLSPAEAEATIRRLIRGGGDAAGDVLPRLIKKYSKTPLGVAPFLTRPAAQTSGDDLDALKETYGLD